MLILKKRKEKKKGSRYAHKCLHIIRGGYYAGCNSHYLDENSLMAYNMLLTL